MGNDIAPELYTALQDPAAYPHRPPAVQVVNTHVSTIFLAGPYVFKVKKPVDFGFLNFTTLDRRQFYCQREVTLNARLCPDTYLGVVPITDNDGRIAVEGMGRVIDYAVKMRCLPANRMMDQLLRNDAVTNRMIARIAATLADFHRHAETSAEISYYGSPEAIAINTEENFAQTRRFRGITLPGLWYDQIESYSRGFLAEHKHLLQRRIDEGRIRDCHGDLRPEHVCFTRNICIFDCIEFNDRFRYSDVAADLAFLSMELERAGHLEQSRHLVKTYIKRSGDRELVAVLPFYKCYRAYVRGKVEGFKLDQPSFSPFERSQIQKTAAFYFSLALSYGDRQHFAAA